MIIEDVKKELKSYKYDIKLIRIMEEQIEYYNSKLTSCSTEINGMPKGSPTIKDKIAEYVAKLEDLKVEKIAQLTKLENRKQVVENTIFKLEQPSKTLLHITYISGDSLTETAYKMGYTYKHICKLHGKALVEYMKEREKDNV